MRVVSILLQIIAIKGDETGFFLLHIQKLNEPIFEQLLYRMWLAEVLRFKFDLIIFDYQQRTHTSSTISIDLYLCIILGACYRNLVV